MAEWPLLGLRDAGRMIGVNSTALRAAALRGALPARKVGRDWVTTEPEVLAYVLAGPDHWLRRRLTNPDVPAALRSAIERELADRGTK